MPEPFEPELFQIVSEPRQLKAFSDPHRIRILHILSEREATNQQLAAEIGASQARVLHHVRFLLNAGLIVQVGERIKGGNVEKPYRATARLYGMRADPAAEGVLAAPIFESLLQEIVASHTLWPHQEQDWELRRSQIRPERLAEFRHRLLELIAEYWGGPDREAISDPDADLMSFASISFRTPGTTGDSDRQRGE